MDAHFRWFEGEKAQFRFVPYDWAFLFKFAAVRALRARREVAAWRCRFEPGEWKPLRGGLFGRGER
jgi:hypothetical protein